MKMPNIATKPASSDDIDLLGIVSSHSSAPSFSTDSPVACNLPRANPVPYSNMKLTIEPQQQQPSSFASGYPIQVSIRFLYVRFSDERECLWCLVHSITEDKSRCGYFLLRVSNKHSLFSQRRSGGAGVESSCAREAGE